LFESEINQETLTAAIHHAMETVAARLQLDLAVHKMADVSTRDNLTGLFQGRFFRDTVDREIIRAKRNELTFSVCKIQLDDFDKINEIWGTEKRDRLIVDMSKMLQRSIGEEQILSRYEKGAFTFLLSGDSQKKVEEIRKECAKLLSNCRDKDTVFTISTAISVGVSQYNPSMPCSAYDLIKKAGENLMQDKKNMQKDVYISNPTAPALQQVALSGVGS